MIEILTIGYGGKRPHEFFDEIARLNADLVIDVRRDARHAFLGVYTAPSLAKRIQNYVWIPELGNAKKSLSPLITLVDEEVGLARLLCLINNRPAAKRVLLLCAEADENHCHRAYVKRLLQEELSSRTKFHFGEIKR